MDLTYVKVTPQPLGAEPLALPKGGARHRVLGYAWAGAMLITAIGSFWIHEVRTLGPFSPIHILSAVTIIGLLHALRNARRGDICAHRAGMLWLFCAALAAAGAFTLLPGRVMHQVLFTRRSGWTGALILLGQIHTGVKAGHLIPIAIQHQRIAAAGKHAVPDAPF